MLQALLNANNVNGSCFPFVFGVAAVLFCVAGGGAGEGDPKTVCRPFARNMPPPGRTGRDVGCVLGTAEGAGGGVAVPLVETGDALFASRACLRSLKDVDLGVGVDEDDGGGGVAGVNARVETGFMKSSEGVATTVALACAGPMLSETAGDDFDETAEVTGAAVDDEAVAEVSTILMDTRRRFGAAEELEALGDAEVVEGFAPRGGEVTSIGARFCG